MKACRGAKRRLLGMRRKYAGKNGVVSGVFFDDIRLKKLLRNERHKIQLNRTRKSQVNLLEDCY